MDLNSQPWQWGTGRGQPQAPCCVYGGWGELHSSFLGCQDRGWVVPTSFPPASLANTHLHTVARILSSRTPEPELSLVKLWPQASRIPPPCLRGECPHRGGRQGFHPFPGSLGAEWAGDWTTHYRVPKGKGQLRAATWGGYEDHFLSPFSFLLHHKASNTERSFHTLEGCKRFSTRNC